MAKKNFKITTLVGSGAKFIGDLEAPGTVRIDGEIQGGITVEQTLILGETAIVNGEISAAEVIVGGQVNGDITALEGAELLKGCKVFGDITTGRIVIDEAAIFQGRCNMNQEVPEVAPVSRKKPLPKKSNGPEKRSAAAALAAAIKEVKQQELEDEEAAEKKEEEAISE